MKSLLILVLALAINTNVMAQEPVGSPVAPTPVEGTPAAANAEDKALVDQTHKPESAFEGHDKASKKESKKNKNKKNKKGKKHGAKKHRKNKKKQA